MKKNESVEKQELNLYQPALPKQVKKKKNDHKSEHFSCPNLMLQMTSGYNSVGCLWSIFNLIGWLDIWKTIHMKLNLPKVT